jgi:hypothetical protein
MKLYVTVDEFLDLVRATDCVPSDGGAELRRVSIRIFGEELTRQAQSAWWGGEPAEIILVTGERRPDCR